MEIQQALLQASTQDILLKLVFNIVALLAAASFLKGVEIKDLSKAVVAAIILALLNATMGAILDFFSFPLRILTLGLFSFVVDALVLLVASYFLEGFSIRNFWSAFLLAILMAIFNSILFSLFV